MDYVTTDEFIHIIQLTLKEWAKNSFLEDRERQLAKEKMIKAINKTVGPKRAKDAIIFEDEFARFAATAYTLWEEIPDVTISWGHTIIIEDFKRALRIFDIREERFFYRALKLVSQVATPVPILKASLSPVKSSSQHSRAETKKKIRIQKIPAFGFFPFSDADFHFTCSSDTCD